MGAYVGPMRMHLRAGLWSASAAWGNCPGCSLWTNCSRRPGWRIFSGVRPRTRVSTLPYGSLLCSLSPVCPVKTALLQHFCVRRHWTPLGAGSLTFCSWSVMMFLSARPWTSGKESSIAMAISVRSWFKRERRFASLNSSILDTICLVSKHNSDLTGPLTGVFACQRHVLKRRKPFTRELFYMSWSLFFHALLHCNEFTFLCITKRFMYFCFYL